MSLRLDAVYSEKEAALLNPLQLAYLGDAIWEMVVRDTLLHRGLNIHHLHKTCVQYVNAHAQATFIAQLTQCFNNMESEIARRGRNSHPHHPAPKNQRPDDYAAATGFEAVIGYLYLTGQDDRIAGFARMIIGGQENG